MSGVKDLEHNDVLLFQRQCRSLAKSASTGKHVSALQGRKELERFTDWTLSDPAEPARPSPLGTFLFGCVVYILSFSMCYRSRNAGYPAPAG